MADYFKLVRDKIPEIIEDSGKVAEYDILDDDMTYLGGLAMKLKEEVDEWLYSGDTEELADILEVLYAIAKFYNLSVEELEEMRKKKADERGSFDERIFLNKVYEKGGKHE